MKDSASPLSEITPTIPCSSSLGESIAVEVLEEARVLIAQFPTGKWSCSLKDRLSAIEREVHGWTCSEPSADIRKQTTAQVLDLFFEIVHEGSSEPSWP